MISGILRNYRKKKIERLIKELEPRLAELVHHRDLLRSQLSRIHDLIETNKATLAALQIEAEDEK